MTISQLTRPEGALAYEIAGDGPLIVCVPGMGDLRSTYRHLVPGLVATGHRVATLDLRGHGDSDTTFSRYDDEALASDVAALIEHLGGPATIVGNSMAAGAAVIVAAQRPELVAGLVLLGGFVRNPSANPLLKLAMRALLAPAWVAPVWKGYLPSLHAGRTPDDHAEYLDSVAASMRLPGHAAAFSRTARTTHDPAERALPDVTAPALVITGANDPDWKDPRAEAEWVGAHLDAEVVILEDCGHYPQSQQPELVLAAVERFLETSRA